ncbi:glycoside hydrolase family 99-like domain-containing protein [Thermodesulfobacterium hveragerdense]|uniref:glycoside hydrolase family 99-like domain-containing protein n=1 Tax=Thermodesulfobacterium hveragerdense TaxID=53424 RepID=UPI00040D0BF4|nr:glycoside hydrolase family 99-like domain-containing protein [Thermodesulfobacterium hveragerdense]
MNLISFYNPKPIDPETNLYVHLDPLHKLGISGWIVEEKTLNSRIIEVWVNQTKFFERAANLYRADISAVLGKKLNCGFFITWKEINLPCLLEHNQVLKIKIIDKLSGAKLESLYITSDSFLKILQDKKIEEEYQIIKDSWLFDETWYFKSYPDVKEQHWDPITHYILVGWKEGRDPSPNFDTDYYLFSNVEIVLAQKNPLTHYILEGRYKGRRAKPVFSDSDYKLSYFQGLKVAQKGPSFEFFPETDVDLSETRKHLPFKLIAFYLPQFHPIPENDLWWGKGFTEWTNVTKAMPNFLGHYQPNLPIDLGFYDLRVPEVRKRQIEMAKKYGIAGFCFYVYWFSGKRLLEKPVDAFFEDEVLDFNFCISWANENWTRRWDGKANEVLMPQIHTYETDCRFIHDMAKYLAHKNYLKIEGRPVILVQRAHDLADPVRTAEYWKSFCIKQRLGEPILVAVHCFNFYEDPNQIGFDAALEFPPLFRKPTLEKINQHALLLNPDFQGAIFDYNQAVEVSLNKPKPDYRYIRTALVSWDNTPRRQDQATIFAFSSPYLYKKWLSFLIKKTFEAKFPEERLVFINAWNEWAEGNHLEPDRKHGYAYLQATAEAILENLPSDVKVKKPKVMLFKKGQRIFYENIDLNQIIKQADLAVILHLYYPDLWEEFKQYLRNLTRSYDLFVSIPVEVCFDTDQIFDFHANSYVYRNLNRGRDIAPFFEIFKTIYPMGYLYGLKIHSKKSIHRPDGEVWRKKAIKALVGSPEIVEKILKTFEKDKRLGIISGKDMLTTYQSHVGTNQHYLKLLCHKLDIQWDGKDFLFPAGSMFWFRFEALKDLLKLELSFRDFEPEFYQIDGCLHHALERFFGLLVSKTDYFCKSLD